jgi:co-chaperonin GroES (HSP10)
MPKTIVKGNIRPIKNRILVTDMHFGETKSKGGIIILDDDAKDLGVHPRWCKVWAVGPTQEDVEVGQWVLVAHGRWTRSIELHTKDTKDPMDVRMVDEDDVMIKSWDVPPREDYIMAGYVNTGGNLDITAKQSALIAEQKAAGQSTAGYYSSSTAKPYTYRKKTYKSGSGKMDG